MLKFGIFIFILWAVSFAAWITHVVVCIKAATYGLLIAGAILAPIGVIHGFLHWFGVW